MILLCFICLDLIIRSINCAKLKIVYYVNNSICHKTDAGEFRVKSKKLGFVYLEKAFDRVPREVTKWTMCKLRVDEWLVSAVMSVYMGSKTVVRTAHGNTDNIEVTGMHEGLALSPLLFVIVMEAVSREFRDSLPWELLYVDDLTMIAESKEELVEKLNRQKDEVEGEGMKLNTCMNETSYDYRRKLQGSTEYW